MKRILTVIGCILLSIWLLSKCSGCGSVGSVESLYGTYSGTDNHGNNVKIELTSESDDEWTKFGTDYSDNLVWIDSYGHLHDASSQYVKWTWDLSEGYVRVFPMGHNTLDGDRYVIDVKGGKIYKYWGDYLDKRNGFSYTFSK